MGPRDSRPEIVREQRPTKWSALGGFLRGALLRGTETVVALALVLVCFLGFTTILTLSFPTGTGLKELLLSPMDDVAVNPVRLDSSLVDRGPTSTGPVASLRWKSNVVKHKPAEAMIWSDARTGIGFGDRHSVQTFSRASAQVDFTSGHRITLGENSLLVVRSEASRAARSGGEATAMLFGGQLFGDAPGGVVAQAGVALETATGAVVRIRQEDTRYALHVNADRSTTLSIYSGSGEIESGGKSVTLRTNQTVTVPEDEQPGQPVELPPPPSAAGPADGTRFAFRGAPPRVTLRWEGAAAAQEFRLVIGKDRELRNVIYDGAVGGSEFTHGNLQAGSFFWTVRAKAGRAEGPGSGVREFHLVRDEDPPALHVARPEDTVRDARVVLQGHTEPGAEVFVGAQPVPTSSSGKFEYDLPLDRGLNMIVVEAVDAAGNITYQSHLIKADY